MKTTKLQRDVFRYGFIDVVIRRKLDDICSDVDELQNLLATVLTCIDEMCDMPDGLIENIRKAVQS
jgi:hypothetical protein